MKVCRRCFEAKPFEAFQKDKSYQCGYKATCKACRAKRRIERRTNASVEPLLRHIELDRAVTYIHKLYKKYNKVAPLEIPVRRRSHVASIPKGCVIRPVQGKNLICIATLKGVVEYQWELVGPEDLLRLLTEHNMRLVIPEPKDLNNAEV